MFTYEVAGNSITITDYPGGEEGVIAVPAEIEGKPVTTIGSFAFAWNQVSSVTIPDSVTRISESAFLACEDLRSVMLPSHLDFIGPGAFRGCEMLEALTLPSGITEIGERTFSGCRSLTELSIPQGVTTIGLMVFRDCGALRAVELPSSVDSIGGGAFWGCSSLREVVLPPALAVVPEQLFAGCDSLEAVTIPEGVAEIQYSAFLGCDSLSNVTIPESVTALGDFAFFNCDLLQEITIPTGVIEIGRSAFSSCSALTAVWFASLSQVQVIGESAFASCAVLTQLSIPSGLSEIGPQAFSNCRSLASIGVAPGNTAFVSDNGVLFDAARIELVHYPAPRVGPYAVPNGVRVIAAGAFYGCGELTSVFLPETIESIGSYSFRRCRELIGLNFPPTVESIGSSAFSGCSKLQHLDLSGLTSLTILKESVFELCSALRSVEFPPALISIGELAFGECESLRSISLPSTLASIGVSAFEASGLHGTVQLPASVESLGERSFAGSLDLAAFLVHPQNSVFSSRDGILYNQRQTSLVAFPPGRDGPVSIPSGVEEISPYAFAGCSRISRVTIPATTVIVGTDTFWDCDNLMAVYFLGDAPTGGLSFYSLTPATLTSYFLSSRSGFSQPTWMGRPSFKIEEIQSPSAPWLMANGYAHDEDLGFEPDGSGVSLLMAYALDLDPGSQLGGQMPIVGIESNSLQLTFFAGRKELEYRIETSTDLMNWAEGEATLTEPDPDGLRTASVELDGPLRFLRLMIEQ